MTRSVATSRCSGISGSPLDTVDGSTTCQATDALAAPGAKVGARVTAHGAGDVACSPVAAEFTASPFDLCAVTPSGTCQNGDACVETGGTLHLCVLLPGDVDCPAGRPVRTALVSDTTCECTCGTEQECGAGAELEAFQQQSCTSAVATIPADGACHDLSLPSVKGVVMTGSFSSTAVSCVEQAPTSDGATTLCCPW